MSAAGIPRRMPVAMRAIASLPPPVDVDELLGTFHRIVVVAPHPDDETLGVGGLLATLLRRGFPAIVIAVTDGEASRAAGGVWSTAALRVARPLECTLAMRELGWQQPLVHRLQLPDGKLADNEAVLVRRLETLLHDTDHVFTTWQHDGHPDHEATSRAVWTVARAKGCARSQFPVWSHSRMLYGEELRVRARLRRFNLDGAALQRKRRALRAYRSQLVDDPGSGAPPVVPPAMVHRFLLPFEVFIQ